MGFEAVGTFRDVGYKFDAWHDVFWAQRPLATTEAADRADPKYAQLTRAPAPLPRVIRMGRAPGLPEGRYRAGRASASSGGPGAEPL
jgi:hypothetical protein